MEGKPMEINYEFRPRNKWFSYDLSNFCRLLKITSIKNCLWLSMNSTPAHPTTEYWCKVNFKPIMWIITCGMIFVMKKKHFPSIVPVEPLSFTSTTPPVNNLLISIYFVKCHWTGDENNRQKCNRKTFHGMEIGIGTKWKSIKRESCEKQNSI